MHRSFLLSATLAMLTWMPRAVHGEPVKVVDQLQPDINILVGGLAIGGASEQMLAQTVTVRNSGELTGVFLPVACDSGALVIEIRTVEGDRPGATVLRRRRVLAEEVSSLGPVFRLFRLGDGLSFVAGDRFALVLRNPTGSCGIFRGPTGDPYQGGEAFFDARPNLPAWVPFSETDSILDLPFMTVMRVH